MMKKTDYYLLIHKFLSGEISEQENEALENWLELRVENKVLFDEIKLIWDNSASDHNETKLPYNPEEELLLIQKRMQKEVTEKEKKTHHPPTTTQYRLLKTAAVILLLVVSNLATWYFFQSNDTNFPEIKNGRNFNELLLPDGSKVYVNKNTTFSFYQSQNKREAYLQGEAFFDVTKNHRRPFFVHLPNASVKVIGTSFNVKSNTEEDSTIVTVISGEVEFFNHSKSIKIAPGEQAVLSVKSRQIVKHKNSDLNFDSWKTGIFRFNDTEMSRILALLTDHYDVSFQVNSKSILSCRFTGTFQNDRLETVLQVLSYGLDFDYRFYEEKYILSGKGCERNN